jgi:uncharacterized protein (DUF983 family)
LQSFNLDEPDDQEGSTLLHSGARCPQCGTGILDYDGLLNLACAFCGFNIGGGGGCT